MHTYIHTYKDTYKHTHTYIHTYTHIHTYIHTYIHVYIHTYTRTHTHIHTYELAECIPCFTDNRGRFGATGSDLDNCMRKYVKAKRILISPETVRHLNMCVLSQNPTHIQCFQI